MQPDYHCFNCNTGLTFNTTIECVDTPRRQGDFTICMYCGQPYIYGEGLTYLPLPRAVFDSMPQSEKDLIRGAWKIRGEIIGSLRAKGLIK